MSILPLSPALGRGYFRKWAATLMMNEVRGVMLAAERMDRQSASLLAEFDLIRPWTYASEEAFLSEIGPQVRAIATRSMITPPVSFLERLPNLGLIASFTTGFEGVDLDWCRARGIQVTNGAAMNGDDVADHAAAMLIGVYRRFTQGGEMVRGTIPWRNQGPGPGMSGRSVRGRKVGIIGMGRIGQAIAHRLEAFGMQISWYGPNPKPHLRHPRAESLMALAQSCDALVLAAPANDQTYHLVNRQLIEALGPEGVVVNIARGSLVDEDALIAALKEGRLFGAGLDVFDPEPTNPDKWIGVPNIELTPHSSGATTEAARELANLFRENFRRFFAGEPLASPVL